MKALINKAVSVALKGENVPEDMAMKLMGAENSDLVHLLSAANEVREAFHGNEISLCSIVNAKNGLCPEDCAFCAQSVHHDTDTEPFDLISRDKMLEAARSAAKDGAREFSIVTSGKSIERDDLDSIASAISAIKDELGMETCSSLGILNEAELKRLKEAGLTNYHHNLETSRSFFPEICTTHSYDEDVDAVQTAKSLGFKVCCGGIFGMGENFEQRIELAVTLREIDVDCIPINFLNPIKGTRLEGDNGLTPLTCLKIIALYRLMLPTKHIFICGGREANLKELQPMMFLAGANGTLTGNYLTTSGNPAEEDRKMIQSLGMKVK